MKWGYSKPVIISKMMGFAEVVKDIFSATRLFQPPKKGVYNILKPCDVQYIAYFSVCYVYEIKLYSSNQKFYIYLRIKLIGVFEY